MFLENDFNWIIDNVFSYFNPGFLLSIKNNFDSFFKYFFEYVEKTINSERIISLEKRNSELIRENIVLKRNIKELGENLSLLVENIINNFWFYLFITTFLIFIYYISILLLKVYFKELFETNFILKHLFPNKYLKLKENLNNLKLLLQNYNENLKLTEDTLKKNNKIILDNKDKLKNIELKRENFFIKKEQSLKNYTDASLKLKNYLNYRNDYIYTKNDIENMSKFFIHNINTYNVLILNTLISSNAMFSNFIEFIKLLKHYENCREIVYSKYIQIRSLNFAGYYKYIEEKQLNDTFELLSKVKNNQEIAESLVKIKTNLKLADQTDLNMITENRHFFVNKFFEFILKDERNHLLTIHTRLTFHLNNFFTSYQTYIKNYKLLVTSNRILKNDITKILDKTYIEQKVKHLKNIELCTFKELSFKKEPKSKEEILKQDETIKFYKEMPIEDVEHPFCLNLNKKYISAYTQLSNTDFYKDTKLDEFEGSYELIN